MGRVSDGLRRIESVMADLEKDGDARSPVVFACMRRTSRPCATARRPNGLRNFLGEKEMTRSQMALQQGYKDAVE